MVAGGGGFAKPPGNGGHNPCTGGETGGRPGPKPIIPTRVQWFHPWLPSVAAPRLQKTVARRVGRRSLATEGPPLQTKRDVQHGAPTLASSLRATLKAHFGR